MPKPKKGDKQKPSPSAEAAARDHFFYGKLLKPGDFTDEQQYLRRDANLGTPATPVVGVLRAVVTNNLDPMAAHRVQIQIPALAQSAPDFQLWAAVVQPAGTTQPAVPDVGDEVVVAFENGDLNHPYIIGFLWKKP